MNFYTEADFKNLLYNPMIKERMLDKYPVLKEIVDENMATHPKIDEYIRYTIMLCEPKSALIAAERDLTNRKSIAKELAGFELNEEQENELYTYKDELAYELTIRYLKRFCKSREFAAIIAFENCYEESIRLLLKPIEDKIGGQPIKDKEILESVQKKSAIKNEIKTDLERIKQLSEEFFGEDVELTKKAVGRITAENVRNRLGKIDRK